MSERDDELPLVAPHDQGDSVSQSQRSVIRKPLPPKTVLKYEELRGCPIIDKPSCLKTEERKEDDEPLAPKSFDQEPDWHKWYGRSLAPGLRKLRSTSDEWYKKHLSPTLYKLETRWIKWHRKYIASILRKLEPKYFRYYIKHLGPTLRKLELWWNKWDSKYLALKLQKKEMGTPKWHRILKHCGVFLVLATIVSLSLYWLSSIFQLATGSPDAIPIAGMYFAIPSCQSGKPGLTGSFFVGIDIPIGKLSFAQAKTVDLAWNWVAGRGIQTILILLCYRVYADVLMRITEVHHIHYDTFTSLAIYSTRLDTMLQFGKTLFKTPGWRVKFTMAWLLISTAYLATFPSLMDIMSGYEASYLSQLNLPTNASIVMDDTVFSQFSNVYFNPKSNPPPANSFFNSTFTPYANGTQDSYPYVYHWYDPTLEKDWSESTDISSTLHRSIYDGSTYVGSTYVAMYQNSSGFWYLVRKRPFFMEDPERYSCVIVPNIYHWGFSAGWIIAVAALNSAWLIGLWIIWVDADHNSQFCRKGRRMGVYRGMMDISEAIREDLGDNTCAYYEEELAAAVQRQGPIKYYVSDVEDGQPAHIGLSSRQSAKVKLRWDQKYGSQLRARKPADV